MLILNILYLCFILCITQELIKRLSFIFLHNSYPTTSNDLMHGHNITRSPNQVIPKDNKSSTALSDAREGAIPWSQQA